MSTLNDETINHINNLLDCGAGVTLDDIAEAAGCEAGKALEAYLLRQIAIGRVARHWNNAHGCHFYLRRKP